MAPTFASAALCLLVLLATPAWAVLTNITVDDSNSAFWTFVGGVPGSAWNAITPSTPCPGCSAQPDPTQAYNSTWHDGTDKSGWVIFRGAAIYIYGINLAPDTAGTRITFQLNNASTGGFYLFPLGSNGTAYNVPFFSATDLDPGAQHNASFSGQAEPGGPGAMLLDYAVITVDQPDPATTSPISVTTSPTSVATSATSSPSPSLTPTRTASRHKSKTGVIIGVVVAVIGGLALLGGVLMFLHRRRRKPASSVQSNFDLDPGDNRAAAGGVLSTPGLIVESYRPVPTDEPSFIGEVVPVSAVSPASAPPISTESSPPAATSGTPTLRSESKPPAPVVLSWDPNATRDRESELEDRVRQLEALVRGRPPQYA
ncbi:hypothetical protein C8R47DRAFT_1328135 [Mycena vitilis]|nr:hypothetical protein C8R47DRAFT_1328135 [Mycena vitilis]